MSSSTAYPTPTARIMKEALLRQEEAMRQFAIANGFREEKLARRHEVTDDIDGAVEKAMGIDGKDCDAQNVYIKQNEK